MRCDAWPAERKCVSRGWCGMRPVNATRCIAWAAKRLSALLSCLLPATERVRRTIKLIKNSNRPWPVQPTSTIVLLSLPIAGRPVCAGDRQREISRCRRAAEGTDQRRPRRRRRTQARWLRRRCRGKPHRRRDAARVRRLYGRIKPGSVVLVFFSGLRHPVRPPELHDPGRRPDLDRGRMSAATASASRPCWAKSTAAAPASRSP